MTLLILAAAGLVLSKRLLGDYFSPPAVYNFFWAFSLGMLSLEMVAFDPLRGGVWEVIGISWLMFMGGSFAVLAYGLVRPAWANAPPRFEHLDRTRFERALKVLFAIGILGFLIQVVNLQMSLGFGAFLTDPQMVREQHSNVKYLGFFNILNVANFALGTAYLALYKKPRKWVYLILIWAIMTTLVTTDRTRFFYMVIWGFFVLVYMQRRVNLEPRMIMAGVGTLLVLLGFFVVIAKVYKKEAFDDNMEFVRVPREYAALVDPYIYLTGSYPVLQAFLEDKHEHTHGMYTFGPVVKFIELVTPEIERAELVGKFYRVPIELNACTYLEPFYKDFGFLGIVLCPLFLGVLCTWSYLAMRQRKTLFSVFFTSLLSFCVTISIFVNHFTQIATWYFVAVGYLVYRYSHTSDSKPIGEIRSRVYG
ncbi:MAG: O-antigen polymerase [Acidobacteriota bacterium]|nr:O-antigen polymerase [Acidobacteriota bacterium]